MICFENFQGVPYSHRQSRNGMMNNFFITLPPHVRDSLEDKFKQKRFPSPFSLAMNRI